MKRIIPVLAILAAVALVGGGTLWAYTSASRPAAGSRISPSNVTTPSSTSSIPAIPASTASTAAPSTTPQPPNGVSLSAVHAALLDRMDERLGSRQDGPFSCDPADIHQVAVGATATCRIEFAPEIFFAATVHITGQKTFSTSLGKCSGSGSTCAYENGIDFHHLLAAVADRLGHPELVKSIYIVSGYTGPENHARPGTVFVYGVLGQDELGHVNVKVLGHGKWRFTKN